MRVEDARQDRALLERLLAQHRAEIRRIEALVIKLPPSPVPHEK